ncbi:hypothetical protein KEG38_39160 [Polyangium jinanense]|uniref:hypothetical protein n=1 Tax=Polyangium jinanense TaxID=2829994 RepID=UPI00234259C5|nr:hypothetical protein [Polyangium jinanense]MDC3959939.1 hypothetical protein [Polyangium jinanense]
MDTWVMPRVTLGGDHVKLLAVGGDDRVTPGIGYFATRDGKRMFTVGHGLFVWDVADLTLRRVIDLPPGAELWPLMITPDGRTGIFKTKTGFRRVDLMSGEGTDEDKDAVWTMPLINDKLSNYPQPPITKFPRPALDGYVSSEWNFTSVFRFAEVHPKALTKVLNSQKPPAPRAWLFPDGERWLSLQGFNNSPEVEVGRVWVKTTWVADRWELSVNPLSTEASTGPIRLVVNGRSALVDVAPSANGRALAALTTGLRVWSTDTGELLGEVADVGGADKVALSPDGSAAVTWFSRHFEEALSRGLPSDLKYKASAGFVTVWDVRSGKQRWRKNQGFFRDMEFTGSGRYLFQTIKQDITIIDASTGREKFKPDVLIHSVLPGSDILVTRADARERLGLLSIDTQSYLTSAPGGEVFALLPGATHFVATMSRYGNGTKMLGDGKCVKLRVPENAQITFVKHWTGNESLSAEIKIGEYTMNSWGGKPSSLAIWRANDGALTTLLRTAGGGRFFYDHSNDIPPELEYRSPPKPGGYFPIDPITGGVGPFRHAEEKNYAAEHTTKVSVKLEDAGPPVPMEALTSSVTKTRRGTLALIRGSSDPFWVLNQSDGHAVKLSGHWPRFGWFWKTQFSPSGNLIAVVPTLLPWEESQRLLIYDTRTGALLAEMDFGPRFDQAEMIAFADPARELLVYTQRGALFRFSLDESFPP